MRLLSVSMAVVEGEALDEREPREDSGVLTWCIVRLTGLVDARPDLKLSGTPMNGMRPCDKDSS